MSSPASTEPDKPLNRTRMPRQERRALVLSAAREVFLANGYHATSMDDIAEAAGVSKPVLYQHFPGKHELYEALLDESIASLLDDVNRSLDSVDSPRAQAYACMTAFFDAVVDPSGGLQMVFASDLIAEPDIRAKVDDVIRDAADLISARLSKLADLTDPESRLLSIYLVGLAEVGSRYWADHKQSKVTKERAIQIAGDLIWRGLRSFPARTEGLDPEIAAAIAARSANTSKPKE